MLLMVWSTSSQTPWHVSVGLYLQCQWYASYRGQYWTVTLARLLLNADLLSEVT